MLVIFIIGVFLVEFVIVYFGPQELGVLSLFDSISTTHACTHSVTKSRTEVVLEGTFSSDFGPNASWLEIEFKCKPGRTDRRPCIISPYHYRLDWMMWFAAFQNYNNNPWLIHLAAKIVSEDPSVESLIEYNPFRNKPPK